MISLAVVKDAKYFHFLGSEHAMEYFSEKGKIDGLVHIGGFQGFPEKFVFFKLFRLNFPSKFACLLVCKIQNRFYIKGVTFDIGWVQKSFSGAFYASFFTLYFSFNW